MTAKEKVAAIKKIMFGEGDPEVKLAEYTLADGTTVVKCDGEIKEGAMVTDAEGAPLADGEYTLSDGTVFVVASGKVTKAATPAPAAQDDKALEEIQEAIKALGLKIDKFEATTKEVGKQKEAMSQIVELMEQIVNEEKGEPVKKVISLRKQEGKEERFKKIAETLKTLKK